MKTKLSLTVLVLITSYGAYRIGRHLWGQHHYIAAQQAIEQRDFRQAGFHLEKCLVVWPHDVSLRLLAARTARRRGDFDQASRELRAHSQENGPEKDRLRELQLCLALQGDRTQAHLLMEAFAHDPQAPESYLTLEAVIEGNVKALEQARDADKSLVEGSLARELAGTEEALAQWLEQRRGRADQVQGLLWRGKLHLLGNAREEGIADFCQALDLDPDHCETRLQLALSLADSIPIQAAGHLEILRRRDPRNQQVAILLASVRRGLGQLQEAQLILDEILTSSPDHYSALIERGKLALDAGRPAEAEPFLRRALARAPNEPVVLLALSRCLHLTDKEDEAKRLEQRYSEIETQRTQADQSRSERERTLRNRVQLEIR